MVGSRWLLGIAALSGFLGVAIGAFGAHGLPEHLAKQGFETPEIQKKVANCETGVRYQMFHTLAILAIALTPIGGASRVARIACFNFLIGILLFSGGLYATSILDSKLHWIIPIGGVFYLTGWGCLVGASICKSTGACSIQSATGATAA